MEIKLEPESETVLRALAERAGVTTERYAAEALSAHVGAYDKWFAQAVERGLKDVTEGRVLSPEASNKRDEARRARLASRIR